MIRLAIAMLLVLTLSGCKGTSESSSSSSSTTSTGATSSSPAAVSEGAAKPETASAAAPASPGKVHHLADGLVYEDLAVGDGKMADPGLTVVVQYTGWLLDGTQFDSSKDRNQPLIFVLGAQTMVRGMEEGVQGMRIGGRRKLTIPPDLAYGAEGRPPRVPPNSTLVFEVELLGVK